MSNTNVQLTKRVAVLEARVAQLEGKPTFVPLTGAALVKFLLTKSSKVLCAVSDSDISTDRNPADSNRIAFVTGVEENARYPFKTVADPYTCAIPINSDGTVYVHKPEETITLTGNALSQHLIATGQVPFRAKVSDNSDASAIHKNSIHSVTGLCTASKRTFSTTGASWDFAVPVDENDQPLVREITATGTRIITGSELADYLITTNQVPFLGIVSDTSDERACSSLQRNEQNPRDILGFSSGSSKYRTQGFGYDYVVPVDANGQQRYETVPDCYASATPKRALTGSALADHLIALRQTPFRAFHSDDSDDRAIREADITEVVGLSPSSSWKYATKGCSWDYVVPVDENNNPITLYV